MQGVVCCCTICDSQCRSVDPDGKTITVQVYKEPVRGLDSAADQVPASDHRISHQLPYDILVLAVGSRR